MGEPAGIGGDIALMAWTRAAEQDLPAFFVIDDPARLAALASRLGLSVPITPVATPAEAVTAFPRGLPVLAETLPVSVAPGQPDPAAAPAVLRSIERAVALAQTGAVAGVVTLPIHKAALQSAGFEHPGHTEFLSALCGGADPVMMLASTDLRVVPVTIHLPLAQVADGLTSDAIVAKGRITAAALTADFGIANPRLAVAALNPHAGESGRIGREEIEIIAPAVARLQAAGIAADGPHAADTLFHAEARQGFDAVLCMYHDQALIPLKTLDFWAGVNVTLGLPIIRTSPDHGTAFGLAGSGAARPDSFIAALRMAADIARRRPSGR